MKTIPCFILCLTATALLAFGQPTVATGESTAKQSTEKIPQTSRQNADNTPQLTKFDLDFKGGTPQELIDAIGAARGKPVNAIIPSDARNGKLPAFKVQGVDVAELFAAMLKASYGYELSGRQPGTGFTSSSVSFGFLTEGKPTDDCLWYFQSQKRPAPVAENVCRFYLLTPYLNAGLSVDDISTAIQTGWKMFEDGEVSHLSFHKETKLLIAVGPMDKIQMIDDVLRVLTPPPKIVTAPEKR